jgi:hypothetical protein
MIVSIGFINPNLYGETVDKPSDMVSAYIERALCFEPIISDENLERYCQLFPTTDKQQDNGHLRISILDIEKSFGKREPGPGFEQVKIFPYCISVSNSEGNSPVSKNIIFLFYHDDKNKSLAEHIESGIIINGQFTIDFFPNKKPVEFNITKSGQKASTKWSDNEKETSQQNLEILSSNDFIIVEPRTRKISATKKETPKKTIIHPNVKDKEVNETIKRMTDICNTKTLEQLIPFFNYPIVKELACAIIVNIIDGKKREIIITGHDTAGEGLKGYFLRFDEESNVQFYQEGVIKQDYEKLPSYCGPIYSGTKITFHKNNCPALYRTIVKNRLFGRQIEWNDKGEVISDLDIDIPKPWADAPKNVENSQQKK